MGKTEVLRMGDSTVTYSICITTYNAAKTITGSLGSLLSQIDDRFELIVVDNVSTDGSLGVLRKLADQGKIGLIALRCSRGKGRQVAFEHSTGRTVISGLDTDDIFEPVLEKLLSCYERRLPGRVLRVVNSQKQGAVTIAPR